MIAAKVAVQIVQNQAIGQTIAAPCRDTATMLKNKKEPKTKVTSAATVVSNVNENKEKSWEVMEEMEEEETKTLIETKSSTTQADTAPPLVPTIAVIPQTAATAAVTAKTTHADDTSELRKNENKKKEQDPTIQNSQTTHTCQDTFNTTVKNKHTVVQKEVAMSPDPYKEIDNFYANLGNAINVFNRSDYHLYNFWGDSKLKEAIAVVQHEPKIATIKERVLAILTDPSRQLKKKLERREIFMVVFYLCQNLNCRETLQKTHLCSRARELISKLWKDILPVSLTNYIHHPDVVVKFAQKATTFNARLEVLKVYFDENVEEICHTITEKLDLIRYVYSMTFAEIHYQSDGGLRIQKEMSDIVSNRPEEMVQKQLVERRSHRFTPYDVIKRTSTVQKEQFQ